MTPSCPICKSSCIVDTTRTDIWYCTSLDHTYKLVENAFDEINYRGLYASRQFQGLKSFFNYHSSDIYLMPGYRIMLSFNKVLSSSELVSNMNRLADLQIFS